MTKNQSSVIWLVKITPECVVFNRTFDGCVDVAFAPVFHDVAAVYAAAIVQGFEPPRCGLDTHLAGQIQPAPACKIMPAEWEFEIRPAHVVFRRRHEGRVIESYCPVPHGLAAISAAAISQGFEPPRCLVPFGKPLG